MHRRPLRSRLAAAALVPLLSVAAPARAQSPPDSSQAAPSLPAAGVRRWQTGALRADRLQHASLAFALAAGIGATAREPRSGFAATFALALLKECWDARRTSFDAADLAASTAGAAAGAATAAAFDR